jgi:hypothetical protein
LLVIIVEELKTNASQARFLSPPSTLLQNTKRRTAAEITAGRAIAFLKIISRSIDELSKPYAKATNSYKQSAGSKTLS